MLNIIIYYQTNIYFVSKLSWFKIIVSFMNQKMIYCMVLEIKYNILYSMNWGESKKVDQACAGMQYGGFSIPFSSHILLYTCINIICICMPTIYIFYFSSGWRIAISLKFHPISSITNVVCFSVLVLLHIYFNLFFNAYVHA